MNPPFFDQAPPNIQKLELLRKHFPQAIEQIQSLPAEDTP